MASRLGDTFEVLSRALTYVRVCLPDLRSAAIDADRAAASGPAREIGRACVLLEGAERELATLLEHTSRTLA